MDPVHDRGSMEPVHDRGSMEPVHESGPWTRFKVGVHGPLVHVLSSPVNYSGRRQILKIKLLNSSAVP